MGKTVSKDLPGGPAKMNRQAGHQRNQQRLWERYMEIEHQELEERKNGELESALGSALPGESQEEVDRLAREDREKAEQGLVGLRDGEELWYKHIDELTLEDRAARIEAQRRRLAWLGERLGRSTGAPSAQPVTPRTGETVAQDGQTGGGP